jgi:hypothetical protein
MDEETGLLDQNKTDISQPSAREQLTMLVQSGRQLIESEIAYIQGRMIYSGQIVKQAGLLGALSLFSLFGAVIALILGILLVISSYIGPEIATLAVTISFAACALLFALLARRSARKLAMPELSNPELSKDKLDG